MNSRDCFSDVMKLCDHIRRVSSELHRCLPNGHLEQVCENGSLHRLQKSELAVERQFALKVLEDDGVILAEYVADLNLDWPLIVEIKARETLHDAHTAQALGDLRAARIKHRLLINFGSPKLQIKKTALLDDDPTTKIDLT